MPLDEITLEALREWKLRSQYSKPDDYVFGTRTGHVFSQDKILDVLSAVMKAASLVDKEGNPLYGLHALRHFFASWCINSLESGGRELTPKKVQELLGHSTIAMTLDLYGHFPGKGRPQRIERLRTPTTWLDPGSRFTPPLSASAQARMTPAEPRRQRRRR